MKDKYLRKVINIISSKIFFWVLLILFFLQASWIAISAVYPMAFDEDYHFGLIQLYSRQLSPFFSAQPQGANIYGAVTRDPSYMYHYLMSFIYRIVEHITGTFYAQIYTLRFIDVIFFTLGIYVFWKFFKKIGLSPAVSNMLILFFTLTPLTSLLAAQINYDNLLFLLTGWALLVSVGIIDSLKNKNKFPIVQTLLLISICCFTSLVKYTFLPLFFAIGIYLTILLIFKYKRSPRKIINSIKNDYKTVSKKALYLMGILALISVGLFIERYGYNVYKFHSPVPECNQVMSVQACSEYGAWYRNYTYLQQKSSFPHPTFYQYGRDWTHTMIYGLFFTINGINSGFLAKPPLPLPEWTAVFVAVIGSVGLVVYAKKIFHKNDINKFLLTIILVYVIILWLQNYIQFLHLGRPVAVQGRYLVPVLIPIYILMALSFRQMLRKNDYWKVNLAVLATVLFLFGGGAMTYIIRSDPTWFNDNDTKVVQVNGTLQKKLVKVVPGSNL